MELVAFKGAGALFFCFFGLEKTKIIRRWDVDDVVNGCDMLQR